LETERLITCDDFKKRKEKIKLVFIQFRIEFSENCNQQQQQRFLWVKDVVPFYSFFIV